MPSKSIRADITDTLVHWVKGDREGDAFRSFFSILREECLRGGSGYIRGGFTCVCFSEAPVDALGRALMYERNAGQRYWPYGVMVAKKWLFAQGGRPVIYGPEQDYHALRNEQKWRYVNYDPISNSPVDFTWEREWRIQTESLRFSPECASLVMPDRTSLRRLVERHEIAQDDEQQLNALMVGDNLAYAMRSEFRWQTHIVDPSLP